MLNLPPRRGPGRPKGSRNRPKTPDKRNLNQERNEATRARILTSAIACIAEVGRERTTLDMIAMRASLKRGGIEHHFTTRALLFAEAAAKARGRLAELVPSRMGIVELILTILDDEELCAAWRLSPQTRRAEFGPLFEATIENSAPKAPEVRTTCVALDLTVLQGLLSSNREEISVPAIRDLVSAYARQRQAVLEGRDSRGPPPSKELRRRSKTVQDHHG